MNSHLCRRQREDQPIAPASTDERPRTSRKNAQSGPAHPCCTRLVGTEDHELAPFDSRMPDQGSNQGCTGAPATGSGYNSRTVVDCPARFGPTNPSISPGSSLIYLRARNIRRCAQRRCTRRLVERRGRGRTGRTKCHGGADQRESPPPGGTARRRPDAGTHPRHPLTSTVATDALQAPSHRARARQARDQSSLSDTHWPRSNANKRTRVWPRQRCYA